MSETQNQTQRILVVEDDPQVRKMFCKILQKKGYQVVEAREGEQALSLYRQEPADLVLLDLFMPGMEGMETLRELLTHFPAAKVIAVSGGGRIKTTGQLDIAVKLGAKRAITKPCSVEELTRAVEEVLSGPA
jgi:CheY-like chemotaxis protein